MGLSRVFDYMKPLDKDFFINSNKDPAIAGALSLLLGWLGIHKFYLGKTGAGIIILALLVVTLGLSVFVVVPVTIYEAIKYFSIHSQLAPDVTTSGANTNTNKTNTNKKQMQSKPVTQKQEAAPASNNKPTRNDPESDYALLIDFYKRNKMPDEFNPKTLLKEANPHANPSVCPYCGVKHEFVAKRARKCPDCGEKMIVRSGLFLTEEQVEKFEELNREFYKKQSASSSLEYALKRAQDSKISNQAADFHGDLAEAFRHAAKIENIRDQGGFSFWDKSWRYFNQAKMEEAQSYNGYYSNLSRISYEMADMLVDQALEAKTEKTRRRLLRRAVDMIVLSIAEAFQFDEEPYIGSYIYERTKIIMKEASMSEQELDEISNKTASRTRLNNDRLNHFNNYIDGIKKYELIGESILY